MKLLITGGHLAPALGVIDNLSNNTEVIFVGKKYSLDNEKSFSLEYMEIEKRKLKFYELKTTRLTRIWNLTTLISFFRFPLGLISSLNILLKEKPEAILSFGGYIAFPVCLMAYLINIPIFIHEQTISPGLSNRYIGKLAKKIFISFEETEKYFPKSKIVLTGNPIRKDVLTIKKIPFRLHKNKPVIYVTGGSLGSHSINILIEKIVQQLLTNYIVIHQIGNIQKYHDYERIAKLKNSLPIEIKNNYFIKEHFYSNEMGYVYSVCDLVLGRSGANTIFELIVYSKPAILIPLPWSAENEQLKHALLFQNNKVGEIFNQKEEPHNLLKLIIKTMENITNYKENFTNLKSIYNKNASKIIIQTIQEYSRKN